MKAPYAPKAPAPKSLKRRQSQAFNTDTQGTKKSKTSKAGRKPLEGMQPDAAEPAIKREPHKILHSSDKLVRLRFGDPDHEYESRKSNEPSRGLSPKSTVDGHSEEGSGSFLRSLPTASFDIFPYKLPEINTKPSKLDNHSREQQWLQCKADWDEGVEAWYRRDKTAWGKAQDVENEKLMQKKVQDTERVTRRGMTVKKSQLQESKAGQSPGRAFITLSEWRADMVLQGELADERKLEEKFYFGGS